MPTGCAPIDTVPTNAARGTERAAESAAARGLSLLSHIARQPRRAAHSHHEQRDTQQGPVQLTRQPAHALTAITPERLRRLPFEWSTE